MEILNQIKMEGQCENCYTKLIESCRKAIEKGYCRRVYCIGRL